MPDVLEECGDQLAALGRVGLGFPEAREVFEECLGAVEIGGRGRRGALKFFLERLAAHDVLGLGVVAHQIEVAQAL
ncbi:MAG TPA: hypothetical protein VK730_02160 [Solirubrobacteraceae bacterium]|nr:hypothetical protein [Solirubrobacteraceae bacterium]